MWLPLRIAVALLTLVACTPSQRDDLTGAWETHLSPAQACGGVDVSDEPTDFVISIGSSCGQAGTWRLEFTSIAGPQTDDRRYQFDVGRDGVVEASGTVAATATTLTMEDESGRSQCLTFAFGSGRYEWMLRDNDLRLTLISDHCSASTWRSVLTKRPWSKTN